ncbi:hypothetical protein OIU84_026227 [Salix udensis]|uniref:LETM1-like protein n=1 Tax=Salix udensis TaxID=889485 RepID=A0AAD6PDC9_9ROSI|nr:hypothetical protein OIU84_026227 [Salix udensis]
MKVGVVCRKVYDYIRYDLREIAFPSSLPDPPHIQNRPKLTWRDNLFILKKATRLYCASWVRDIGPDLRPNDYTKDNEANGEAKTTSSAPEKEPSVIEDLAVAARGGMETLRPALQRVYLTRASAYRDALQSFIQGHEHNPWSFATTSLLKSCNPSERIFSCCRLYVFYLLSAWKLFKALFWPFNLLLSPNRLKHWRVLKELLKLKKEAEFLEASFRAKAALLQQGEDESSLQSSISEQKQYLKGNGRKSADVRSDRSKSKFQGLWNFLVYSPTMKHGPDVAVVDASVCPPFTICLQAIIWFWKHYISQFEMPRQKVWSSILKLCSSTVCSSLLPYMVKNVQDVLLGTQLLAIDVAASMGLLKRLLIGDELTEKETKTLRRTMMDLASVVPIGVLMLLPVTAVGHAAMLAAIQRYVPALIPSTYGPERLDLLRQLEKVKEMETSEPDANENGEALS